MTRTLPRLLGCGLLAATASLGLCHVAQADVGQIKVASGQVSVERKGQSLPGRVGLVLEADDVLRTGADGSLGITMRDNSLLSVGPNSILSLEHFEFDPTTSDGRFDARLRRGTLAVVSGTSMRPSMRGVCCSSFCSLVTLAVGLGSQSGPSVCAMTPLPAADRISGAARMNTRAKDLIVAPLRRLKPRCLRGRRSSSPRRRSRSRA